MKKGTYFLTKNASYLATPRCSTIDWEPHLMRPGSLAGPAETIGNLGYRLRPLLVRDPQIVIIYYIILLSHLRRKEKKKWPMY